MDDLGVSLFQETSILRQSPFMICLVWERIKNTKIATYMIPFGEQTWFDGK